MFIPDPVSDFFPSRIPDPNCLHSGSRILIKEFKYFNPQKSKKNGFWALKNMIRVVHPGSWCWLSPILDPGSRIQGSKRYPIPDPGSRIRIRNTVKNRLGSHLIGPKWRIWRKKFFDISQKKFGSAYAQSPRKCSNIEILAKIEGKEAEFLFENLRRAYKDLI